MALRKYPWEEWFGRGRTVLLRGIHYQCSQSTMVQTVRNNASMRGLRIRLTDTDSEIIFEVVGKVKPRRYKKERGVIVAVPRPDTTTIISQRAVALATDGTVKEVAT